MPAARYRSAAAALLCAVATTAALSACGNSSNPNPSPTVTITRSASSSAACVGQPPLPQHRQPWWPLRDGGALVTLNPATGTVTHTLVSAHVLGDEISVSSTGLVFFAVKHGCKSEVEAIPVAGGAVTTLTRGSLPAVSPDGTKLAYADQPMLVAGCVPHVTDLVTLYHVDIRTLSSGATVKLPMVAPGQDSGLPYAISHLSWAADNDHLAVSIAAPEDNEGWNLTIVDTSQAQYYLSGTGVTSVPVTGNPTPQMSYYREGAYMPNGDLFVSRACCGGVPVPQHVAADVGGNHRRHARAPGGHRLPEP